MHHSSSPSTWHHHYLSRIINGSLYSTIHHASPSFTILQHRSSLSYIIVGHHHPLHIMMNNKAPPYIATITIRCKSPSFTIHCYELPYRPITMYPPYSMYHHHPCIISIHHTSQTTIHHHNLLHHT